jgi:triacylglycerol lipase
LKNPVRYLLLAGLTLASGCWNPPAEPPESVVLVHGLGRSSASLVVLRARLTAAGFRVVNFDYPSTKEPIENLVDSLAAAVSSCCEEESSTVHFVTHSMGGVLVRGYFSRSAEPHLGRVVMLSPPNQGSELIDAFSASPLLVSVVGPAGARLGTDSTSYPRRLGPVRFSLGIIAGDRSLSRFGSWLIPGPDDGMVGVDQTRVEGASDFLVVPATHTFIMNRPDVADAVLFFLEHGRFQ